MILWSVRLDGELGTAHQSEEALFLREMYYAPLLLCPGSPFRLGCFGFFRLEFDSILGRIPPLGPWPGFPAKAIEARARRIQLAERLGPIV